MRIKKEEEERVRQERIQKRREVTEKREME